MAAAADIYCMAVGELPLRIEARASSVHVINDYVRLEDFEGCRSVFICGQLLHHYVLGNRDEEAFVIAVLARGGHAKNRHLAKAFGVDEKTVYRYRMRLEEKGAAGIPERKRGPKGPSVATAAFRKRVLALDEPDRSAAEIGRMLGVSHTTIGRILREEGRRPRPHPSLFESAEGGSDAAAEASAAVSAGNEAGLLGHAASAEVADEKQGRGTTDARAPGETGETVEAAARPVAEAVPPRLVERLLARTGRIEEAPPVVEPGTNLRWAGAFLALPGFLEVGLSSAAVSAYGRLRNGFYGLRSVILTLFLMAVARIRSPEGLSAVPPEILGRILGLDRSPEVKTVRRKLRELSLRCRAADFVTELARIIRRENEDLLGFLYVDGHVRAYHGRKKLPKTWVATRRMCLPATTDVWVNDAEGEPFFFVTTEGNPALSKALPEVMREVRGILGEGRRAVVIFDRGGWSVEAVKRLSAMDFDFVTYRRRPYEDLPSALFEETGAAPEERVKLADHELEVKGLGRVRVVAKLDPDGTQVHMLTNLDAGRFPKEEVHRRLARRWRQENFFKYMRAHYAIDSLASFGAAPVDGEREIPNPAWKSADRVVRRKRAEVARLSRLLGEASKEPEEDGRPTLAGFKGAVFAHGPSIARAREELEEAIEARRRIPPRIHLKDLGGEPEVRLEFERKLLTDAVKVGAYRVESGLANAVAPHYRRSRKEGRKLIQEAMRAQGDVEVDKTAVTITLEPLSSAHRTRALERLCGILTAKEAVYPGTGLRLRFAVRTPESRAE